VAGVESMAGHIGSPILDQHQYLLSVTPNARGREGCRVSLDPSRITEIAAAGLVLLPIERDRMI
jgi:hypothetical protein